MTLLAPPLTLNDLFRLGGIPPQDVLVFRHRPAEARLNRDFDWIVAERRDLFDSYQSSHAQRTEVALSRARYLASFIRHSPKTALFVGLYDVRSFQMITTAEQLADPLHQELIARGLAGTKATDGRATLLRFGLERAGWHDEWSGRLIVQWPGLERSWYRWADRNEFAIQAIARENLFTQRVPPWDEVTLEWSQLGALPTAWAAALAQWRGVYLIIDQADGKQYVGSASGSENLLGRWRDYARTGHGGNKLLRLRAATGFRFSILQLVSPDLPAEDVVEIEQSWKRRLRTAAPFGLNEN